MLNGETYITRAKSGPLPIADIENYLNGDALISPAPHRERTWFTATDRGALRYRFNYAMKTGDRFVGGVLIVLKFDFIAFNIVASVAASRTPLVRFLEWLQARCDIVITEDGYGTPPELERVGVRAFLPEELRDQVDALYEEAVRREPAPTFEDELDDGEEEHEGDVN